MIKLTSNFLTLTVMLLELHHERLYDTLRCLAAGIVQRGGETFLETAIYRPERCSHSRELMAADAGRNILYRLH